MMDPEELLRDGESKLAALMQQAADFAQKYVSDGKTVALPPHVLVQTRNPANGEEALSLFMLQVPFNEDEEKRLALFRIGQDVFAQHVMPIAVVLLSEAWLSSRPADAPHVEPRYDPARQEFVIVAGQTIAARYTGMMRAMITRSPEAINLTPFEKVEAKVRLPLLDHFFAGFFDLVMRKYGKPVPGQAAQRQKRK